MDLGDLLRGVDMDDVNRALAIVTDNKESLALLGRLPEFLDRVADGLAGAGEQARSASVALVGSDGESGVRRTLADSAEALAAVVESIARGADRIADAAEATRKVPLMDGPADRLAGAAAEMTEATGRLGELSRAMTSIGDTLSTVAEALGRLGDHLDDSGTQARGFAELGGS